MSDLERDVQEHLAALAAHHARLRSVDPVTERGVADQMTTLQTEVTESLVRDRQRDRARRRADAIARIERGEIQGPKPKPLHVGYWSGAETRA